MGCALAIVFQVRSLYVPIMGRLPFMEPVSGSPWLIRSYYCTQKSARPRGVVTQKMYTPSRTAPRNPYPHWHNICETLPLLAQYLGSNPYPYWHKSTKKGTLCSKTIVEKWLIGTIVVAKRRRFCRFCSIFDILHNLGTTTRKLYPFWHTFRVKNRSGTLLENTTIYDTEILAYVYCRQWECPPSGVRLFSCGNLVWVF